MMSPIKFFILGLIVIVGVWITEPKPTNPMSYGSIYVPMAFMLWSIIYIVLHILSEKYKIKN